MNTLSPVFETSGSGADTRLSSFKITQTAPAEHPTLRSHHVTIAAFDTAGKLLFAKDAMVQPAVSPCIADRHAL